MPDASKDLVQDLEDIGSPMSAFVRDRCRVGPVARVDVATLYNAWCTWCEEEGRDHPGTKQTFGRDLQAAVPGVLRRRGTNTPFYDGIGLATGAGQ